MDRQKLYDRIDLRVDKMMEQGLYEEVVKLHQMGIPRESTAMQGIGYKQIYGLSKGTHATLPKDSSPGFAVKRT